MVSDYPAKLGSNKNCDSGDVMVLVGHGMSLDHVIKRSFKKWVGPHQGQLISCQVW